MTVLPAGTRPSGARSYLHDGRVVVWRNAPPGCALDAEVRRPAPLWLAERAGGEDAWMWWTRLEVHCKLAEIPVLVALRDGVRDDKVALVVREIDGVVITLGYRADPSLGPLPPEHGPPVPTSPQTCGGGGRTTKPRRSNARADPRALRPRLVA